MARLGVRSVNGLGPRAVPGIVDSSRTTRRTGALSVGIAVLAAGAALAACGTSSGSGAGTTTTSRPAVATVLKSADVPGLGTVVVDSRGYTVYVLASRTRRNLPCTSASGCTSSWPPVTAPSGPVTVGSGLHRSLLRTTSADGATVPVYAGWRVYDFYGDTGPGQSGGQGVQSFGGTWSAITPSGARVSTSTTATTSSGY